MKRALTQLVAWAEARGNSDLMMKTLAAKDALIREMAKDDSCGVVVAFRR